MTQQTLPVVATGDLAATDFDVGVTVPGAITLKVATPTAPGKVARLATQADVTAGTPGPVVDAALLSGIRIDAGTDSDLSTNGLFGIGSGVVANVDFGLVGDTVTQVADWGLFDGAAPTTIIDLGTFP